MTNGVPFESATDSVSSKWELPINHQPAYNPMGVSAWQTTKKKSGGHGNLTLYIVVAIIAAVVCSLVFPATSTKLRVGGEVFLRLLQMVVVPLVMASVMSGILGLGDVRKLGRPGGFAIIYYLSSGQHVRRFGRCGRDRQVVPRRLSGAMRSQTGLG